VTRTRPAGLAFALALAFAACTGGGSDSGGDEEAVPTFSPAPEVSNPLGECARNTKIGVVYDHEAQTAFHQGLTLASDQLNQRGSFNYEPVNVSVGGMEAEAVGEVTSQLAGDDGVSVIVSSARDEGAEASVDAARKAGAPLLLVGASSDDVQLGDGVYSLRLADKTEVAVLEDVAASDLGLTRMKVASFPGLIDPDGAYLISPGPGQDPGALMRGIVEITGPDRVVGTSVYAFTDTGTVPEGVHVGAPWYVDVPESINAAFVVDFEEAYGERPTIDAAYGYTSVLLIARTVEEACSNERSDVIAGLADTKDVPSVFGRFSLNAKGEPSHPMYLLKIKNGTPTAP
jgi:ABC-type branched-subunit amino acid transport system substrate-binding protein